MSDVNILIVDDDADLRTLLSLLVEGLGYNPIACANGAEALTLLNEILPVVIILDGHMPVMDGVEFRDAQRGQESISAIPVILLSGSAQRDGSVSLIDPDVFLQKPTTRSALAEAIELCRRHPS